MSRHPLRCGGRRDHLQLLEGGVRVVDSQANLAGPVGKRAVPVVHNRTSVQLRYNMRTAHHQAQQVRLTEFKLARNHLQIAARAVPQAHLPPARRKHQPVIVQGVNEAEHDRGIPAGLVLRPVVAPSHAPAAEVKRGLAAFVNPEAQAQVQVPPLTLPEAASVPSRTSHLPKGGWGPSGHIGSQLWAAGHCDSSHGPKNRSGVSPPPV